MIKDMTDDQLRDYYWQLRTAIDNSGRLAQSCTTRNGLRTAARGMDRNLRHLDICAAVARRRGISLSRPDTTIYPTRTAALRAAAGSDND